MTHIASSVPFLKKIESIKYIFKRDLWCSLDSREILFYDHDAHRNFYYKKKYYAPLIDTVRNSFEKMNKSSVTIAEPYSQIVGNKAFGDVIDFNGSFARASLKRKLLLYFKNENYIGQLGYESVWIKILKLVKPKIVIGINPSASLCFVCHKLGIKVYDLQHGVISETHLWYGAEFRQSLPSNILPSGFLCWNQVSKKILQKWTVNKNIKVLDIGHPWLNRYINVKDDDKLVEKSNKKYLNKNRSKLKTILISLTWGWDGWDNKFFYKNFETTFDHYFGFPKGLMQCIINNKNNYNWKIRLHPVQLAGNELKGILSFLKENFKNFKNVEWNNSSIEALPIILKNADLHITVNSSVVIEASIFQLKSALIAPIPKTDLWLKSYYEHELNSGFVEFVANDSDIISSWIVQNINNKKSNSIDNSMNVKYENFINTNI